MLRPKAAAAGSADVTNIAATTAIAAAVLRARPAISDSRVIRNSGDALGVPTINGAQVVETSEGSDRVAVRGDSLGGAPAHAREGHELLDARTVQVHSRTAEGRRLRRGH